MASTGSVRLGFLPRRSSRDDRTAVHSAWGLLPDASGGVLRGHFVRAWDRLVRRCDGSSYQKYVEKLAKAEGIEEPTKEDLQRLDRGRKGKKLSNKGWKSSTDGQARIAKMKDGTMRLAFKAENAVDLQSGVIVAAEVHGADQGDTATMPKTLVEADEAVMKAGIPGGITDVVGDRGYHADAVVDHLQALGYRTCIAERPQKRNWKAFRLESATKGIGLGVAVGERT